MLTMLLQLVYTTWEFLLADICNEAALFKNATQSQDYMHFFYGRKIQYGHVQ